jgi:hypothetical protein
LDKTLMKLHLHHRREAAMSSRLLLWRLFPSRWEGFGFADVCGFQIVPPEASSDDKKAASLGAFPFC